VDKLSPALPPCGHHAVVQRGEARRRKNCEKFIAECLAIEMESARSAGMLGYMARVFVQATIPHSEPKGQEFVRRNGAIEISILAPARLGLPYGSYPRLLLTWLSTEAVKTGCATLYMGESLSEFMRKLGLLPTGGRWGTIPSLKEQANRLFGSSVMAYATWDDAAGRQCMRGAKINLADEWDLWWDPLGVGDDTGQSTLFQSWVKLSERFLQQVTERPVPLDLRAVVALKKSPLALDLYAWATYRVSYLRRRTEIPWEALEMQFGAGYAEGGQGTRNFKKKLLMALRRVSTVYSGLRAQEGTRGLVLLPSPTHVPRRK
jgi:hypothetical protein